MNRDVKFINGNFYYELNGNYYPIRLPIATIGGGGGGRGPAGAIGATGPQGPTGPAGPASNIPSVTTAQRLALTPTTAFEVYDTDLDEYFAWHTVTNSWSPY